MVYKKPMTLPMPHLWGVIGVVVLLPSGCVRSILFRWNISPIVSWSSATQSSMSTRCTVPVRSSRARFHAGPATGSR